MTSRWAVCRETRRIVSIPEEADDAAVAAAFGLSEEELARRTAEGAFFRGELAEAWRYGLDAAGEIAFEILTRSMVPTLVPGERVRVRPTAGLAPGVVVLAAQTTDGPPGERLIVHRVVRVVDDAIVLQGDNSPLPDAPLARDRVIGVAVAPVAWVRPRLRALWYYLRRRKWARARSIVATSLTRRL